jgi:hypothetical protein
MAGLLNAEVSDIIERRNQSRDYMQDNYWDEFVEVFRALKLRTKPFTKKNERGEDVEDKSRTNVCMPDLNIIWRRNVARLTAQPYRMRYIGGQDPLLCELLSALSYQQYDRSGEAAQDRRVCMGAEAFGFGYSKLYWDTLASTRSFRRSVLRQGQVVLRDRRSIMLAQGAPQDEINAAVGELGPEMNDAEVLAFAGRSGTEIKVPTEIGKYEGPVVKAVFPGDFFMEPGVLTLNDSGWAIEQYTETDLWLQRMAKLTWQDPETGRLIPAFDAKACRDLIDLDPGPQQSDEKISDLKQMFRNVLSQSSPRTEKRLLPNKRFDILEYHSLGDDGRMWVTWINEHLRDKPLGRMPYPWDLCGKYVYTELTPLPDMISAFGDSTPRLFRYLHLLLNYTYGQNFDYVTDLLKKFLLVQNKEDLPDEVVERGHWRELRVRDLRNLQFLNEPSLPMGAFERVAELWRVIGLAEPALNNVDTGTAMFPNAAKTATTAMLASKAADALTQFKIDGRNIYLKELGEKKLWMNQQAAQDEWEVNSAYWGDAARKSIANMSPQDLAMRALGFNEVQDKPQEWALSSRYGKTAAIRLDPMEIQEDYQVEPEAGSFLAVDDELRRAAAMDLTAVAGANPGIVDRRKVVRYQLSTIRGIGNPDEYLLPEAPPDPSADMKKSVTLSAKFETLPPDVQNALFAEWGIQRNPQDAAAEQTVHGMKQLAEGASAAAEMTTPAGPVQPVDPQESL